jgi:hypothetical protein
MPVFYDGSDVRVTDRWFRVLRPEPAVYAITDLGSVWIVVPAPARLSVGVRVSCSSAAAATAVLTLARADDYVHAFGWVCALIAVGIMTVRAAPLHTDPVRSYELWAYHGSGTFVRLYTATDQTEFGKVRRALQRAIEWNESAIE